MLVRNRLLRRRCKAILCLTSVVLFLIANFSRHAPDLTRSASTFLSRPFTSRPAVLEYAVPSIPSECPIRHPASPSWKAAGRAPALAPEELLCRQVHTGASGIPKIFHQSWKSSELPAKFRRWSNTCRDKHADWEWVLWTDENNLQLVRMYFPWLEETYMALPGPIYRADFARNLYMYMFGGVYADLDIECLLSTADVLELYGILIDSTGNNTFDDNSLIEQRQLAVFGRMGPDLTFKHGIPNAWMAASPRHPFFLLPLESAQAEVRRSRRILHQLWYAFPSPEYLTGPVALRESILRWNSFSDAKDEVVLLSPDLIYPYSWEAEEMRAICSAAQATFDEQLCKDKLEVDGKGSLSVTYWSHTHRGTASDIQNIERISHEK